MRTKDRAAVKAPGSISLSNYSGLKKAAFWRTERTTQVSERHRITPELGGLMYLLSM